MSFFLGNGSQVLTPMLGYWSTYGILEYLRKVPYATKVILQPNNYYKDIFTINKILSKTFAIILCNIPNILYSSELFKKMHSSCVVFISAFHSHKFHTRKSYFQPESSLSGDGLETTGVLSSPAMVSIEDGFVFGLIDLQGRFLVFFGSSEGFTPLVSSHSVPGF